MDKQLHRKMPRGEFVGFVILHIVIIAGALVMFFPFLWTIVTSISPGAGLSLTPQLIPENPSLEAYQRLFSERPFARVIFNSFMLAAINSGATFASAVFISNAITASPSRFLASFRERVP